MAYNGSYGKSRGYSNSRSSYSKPGVTSISEVPKPRLRNPSELQIAIFQAVREAGDKALQNITAYAAAMRALRRGDPMPKPPAIIGIHVNALAGTGKTSVTVEKDYYLPAELRNDSVSVAFNSDIFKELEARVAIGVLAKTIHALGRAALVQAFPRLRPLSATNKRKYEGYIRAEFGNDRKTMVARENLAQMIDRARDYLAWTAEDMDPLFDQYEMESGHLTRAEFLAAAEKILNAGLRDTSTIDFGDMIAMPIYHNLELRRYSVVSVDEYQDLCPAQHELLDRSIKVGGIMFTVGDENQAIYLWRGADSDSISVGIARYKSTVYPLNCTYRCGRAIVASAQKYVPGLVCPPNAHEGSVSEINIDKLIDEVNIGDVILSRLNAPMLKICFALIRVGIPANIQGRDVAENLKFMIKRSGAETIDALLDWVEQWRVTETERRSRSRKPIEIVNDTAECFDTLCEGRYDIADVIQAIEDLFPNPKTFPNRIVVLSTVHRAKGKEWKRVFMMRDTFFLKRGNPREEKNLAYVAETRAMNELIMVNGK